MDSSVGHTKSFDTTLTVNQMPSHRHPGIYWSGAAMGLDASGSGVYLQHSWTGYDGYMTTDKLVTGYTGGGQGHSHDIPHIGVWVWKRIS